MLHKKIGSAMDKFIERFAAVEDADLMLCEWNGVAYQRDMSAGRVPYDADYLVKCKSYEGSDISNAVNRGRCALLMRHLPEGSNVIDVGAGSGAFVREAMSWGFDAFGFDVIDEAAINLSDAGRYAEDIEAFEAVTMWDSMEHMENPSEYLDRISRGSRLFVSIPIFEDLFKIRNSKHYRPGEHLYYFKDMGFVNWMSLHGFMLLEKATFEMDAGRQSIYDYAFVKA